MSANNSAQAHILNIALQRLSEYFQQVIPENKNDDNTNKKQLIAAFNTSNDVYGIYQFLKKQADEKKPMSLPFLSLTLDTMGIDPDSAYNNNALYRKGFHIELEDGNYLKTSGIPTVFDCTIKFLTDDFWQMLAFCSSWLIGSKNKSILNFEALWNNLKFSIKVDLADTVSFPAKDNTLDIVNLYEFNGTLKIHGFVGEHNTPNEMNLVSALKTINVETVVIPEGYEILNSETLQNLFIQNTKIEK